jgi:hypothetical protein
MRADGERYLIKLRGRQNMATLSQLQSSRVTAGATYVSALAAFKAAYVALAALDLTLSNRNIMNDVFTFPRDHAAMDDMIRQLQHAQFAPNLPHDWESSILSTSNAQVTAFTPG